METQSKIDTLNSALKQIVERHTPEEGIFQTSVPHLYFVRKRQLNQTDKCFIRPHVSVILQGHKISIQGNHEYHLQKNKCIVTGIEITSSSNFIVHVPFGTTCG